ncbi:hypothetical protein ACFOQM_12330 [Paenibacillus sp. GCM10012307]|uniref:Uncharacterized protein n=1 Tax=Paenibacillus roseus TaxID=2798579 RepID=A0A934MQN5_9BACL|nr:hypothetical protein [Paenibacillus roseus]MBJ6362078.1 hypothetical protein [Paenibacillus roseus]
MAKAIAKCTCQDCGEEFIKTAIKRNRKEADSWEEWTVANSKQCPKCWGAAQRAAEAAAPLTLVVDCDPYGQRIVLQFKGGTEGLKEEIRALGYRWGELPPIGTFGLLSTSRPPLAWHRIIELDQLQTELDKVAGLQPELKNNMTDLDVAFYREIKTRNDAQKTAEEAKKSEIDAQKSAVPRPKVPPKLAGTTWNQKIYGKQGRYRIYPDGVEVNLTDAEADEVREFLAAKAAYKKKIEEIEGNYK